MDSLLSFLLILPRLLLVQLDRPLSQFWSSKIGRMTFLNSMKFVDLLIGRLQNCEQECRDFLLFSFTVFSVLL